MEIDAGMILKLPMIDSLDRNKLFVYIKTVVLYKICSLKLEWNWINIIAYYYNEIVYWNA